MSLMDELAPYFRRARFVTLATCLLALFFLIFFDASKHDPALARFNVFGQDPYDAVGSFGIQLAGLAALLTFVRILRPYPDGVARNHLVLIVRGNAVALLSIAVTVAADGIAMVRYLPRWTGSAAGWLLAAFGGGLLALTALVGWVLFRLGHTLHLSSGYRSWPGTVVACLVGVGVLAFYPDAWQQSVLGGTSAALAGMLFLFVLSSVLARFVFPPFADQGGDLVDDLLAFYHWPGIRARFAGSFCGWMEKLAALPWVRAPIAWLNPRRHPWRAVILVALGLGLALVTAEAIGEGVPNPSVIWLVLTLFITLEGSGVLLGYVLFRQYLGIFSGQGLSKE
jgi:hypothetical protein